MINDKMAKMAINTIRTYCDVKKCDACVIFDACKLTNGRFRHSNGYDTVGTFEGGQKPAKKPPKFDVALYNSHHFSNYMGLVAEEEAKKVGLNFIGGLDKVKCYPNGTIKVWYKSEMDGGTVYKGKAKCHPNDAFNPEIGIKLAVQRIVKKLNKPFVPMPNDRYYYYEANRREKISWAYYTSSTADKLNVAIGNCFRTKEEAREKVFVIEDRLKKVAQKEWTDENRDC
jgi:hypothetical protein|nr:MAG TPA: hypothetical protein [Bacteriophage sp.]